MFVRNVVAFLLVAGAGCQVLAVEPLPFDAAAFVKDLREPVKVDVATRELEKVTNLGIIHTLDFSADVKTLCAVHSNGVIAKWDVVSGKMTTVNRVSAKKVRAAVDADTDTYVETFALSQDQLRLGLALRSGDVVFWDVAKEQVVSRMDVALKGKCAGLKLSRNGKHALLGGDQARGAVVIDTDTGKKVFGHDAAKSDIVSVGISSDDRWAMFVEKDQVVHGYPLLGGDGGAFALDKPRFIEHFKGTSTGAVCITSLNELCFVSGRVNNYHMRVALPARVVVSADGQHVIDYGKDGEVEIRSLQSPWVCWYGSFAEEAPRMWAIGSDGKTLAFESKEGYRLKLLSAPPEHPEARMCRKLRALLAAEDFNALKLIGQQLYKERSSPFAWEPMAAPLDVAFNHLSGHSDAEALFEKWLAHDEDALMPKLLLVQKYVGRAWAARGGDFAAKVTEEGWKGFHEYIGKAHDLIVPICDKPDAPAPARRLMLIIAMAESWDKALWAPHADWMVKNTPGYVGGHEQVVQMLLPRWGGQLGDSELYAARVAGAIGGAEGDAFYAQLWIANYETHGRQPSIVAELGGDFERVKRGLTHLAEKSVNPAYFAHKGLQTCAYHKDRPGAKAFAALIKDRQNDWDVKWWRNPTELSKAIRYAEFVPPK
jgi:hypothetical protein